MAQYKKYSSVGTDDNAPPPESLGEVPRITSEGERKAVLSNQTLVVIDNYTDWCGPCKTCAPQYAALANKYSKPGLCVLVKENVDDELGGRPIPIRGVPCFHFYVNGAIHEDMTVTGGDIPAVEQGIQQFFEAVKKTSQ